MAARSFRYTLVLAAVTVALLAGSACNRTDLCTASIEGEVRLDGKSLEQGVIRFCPMQGVAGAIAGSEIHDGRYRISDKAGPAIGWNRVEISGSRKTGRMIPAPFPQQGMIEERAEVVPPQFNKESTLKYEVKPGSNGADFSIDLHQNGPP
jgi:hypothetical protein